jgi:hypothetical protein
MKLTDKYILNLNHLDKDKFLKYPGVQGLTLRVYKYPSTAKTWLYQYRPKGKAIILIIIKLSKSIFSSVMNSETFELNIYMILKKSIKNYNLEFASFLTIHSI